MSEFSVRLQSLMRQRNVTQRQFAERINVTEASMSRYVNGERMPRMNTVADMATALHTTSDFLLGRDIEHDESIDFTQIKRILARLASSLTAEEKNELISALFAKEQNEYNVRELPCIAQCKALRDEEIQNRGME